jgi:O-antigen/teichoic acid export membrane protein
MLGQYIFALSITAPMFMFSNLQLRSVQSTDTGNQFSFANYFVLRLLTTICAVTVLGVMALSIGQTLDSVAVVLVVILTKAVEAIIDIFQGLLHRRDRLDLVAIVQIVGGLGVTAVMMLTAYLDRRLFPAVVAGGLMQLVTMSILIVISVRTTPSLSSSSFADVVNIVVSVFKRRPGNFNTATLASLGLPLGFTALMISLNVNIPRYFVSHYQTVSELGVFAVLSSFIVAGDVVANATHQACSLRLAHFLNDGDQASFWRLFGKAVLFDILLGCAGIAIAVCFGRSVLLVLFGPEYSHHWDALVYTMLAAIVAYLGGLAYTTLIALRAIRRLFVFQSISTVTTLVFCYALVPVFGISGAAIALALGKLPQMLLCMSLIRSQVNTSPRNHENSALSMTRNDLPAGLMGPTVTSLIPTEVRR